MSDLKDTIQFKATAGGIVRDAEELQKNMQPSGFHPMSAEAAIELGKLLVAIARKQQDLDGRVSKLESKLKG